MSKDTITAIVFHGIESKTRHLDTMESFNMSVLIDLLFSAYKALKGKDAKKAVIKLTPKIRKMFYLILCRHDPKHIASLDVFNRIDVKLVQREVESLRKQMETEGSFFVDLYNDDEIKALRIKRSKECKIRVVRTAN